MNPLERAARALHKDYVQERTQMGVKPSDLPQWDDLGEDGRFLFMDKARSVIAAIREPGQALEAGAVCLWAGSRTKADAKAIEVWSAIIDAMLTEVSVSN